MNEEDSSFQALKSSHSLYFLGQKNSYPPSFQCYQQLMKECASNGNFLSFENNLEWLSCYARDAQPIHHQFPLLAFQPYTIANIAPFLNACFRFSIPVTTRCGGTGLVGSCVPSKEGIVLLTGPLNQIKNYDGKSGIISIEPGVTVRQLNQYVVADGWHFPLSLATEGIAGIAGCVSCHSRGYHQQQQAIFDAIEQVTLVDGQGQILDVPVSLVCGAEGLWGVIIEMKMKLKRCPSQALNFIYSGSWQEILGQLSSLRSLYSLASVIWFKDHFYLQLSGEKWRLPSATAYLVKCLPGVKELAMSLESVTKNFLPSRQNFIVISSIFHSTQLPEASLWSMEQARVLQLECLQLADLLSGSLHLILQSEDDLFAFAQKVEQFLVIWANFVDCQQGILASSHGVGKLMQSYMPPFWSEESQKIWHNLQSIFDPKNLFGKERFFSETVY